MYNWYQEGFVVLPQVLLSHYQDLGLSPETFLLVTTILGQKEGQLSPMAVVELCSQTLRLAVSSSHVSTISLSRSGLSSL